MRQKCFVPQVSDDILRSHGGDLYEGRCHCFQKCSIQYTLYFQADLAILPVSSIRPGGLPDSRVTSYISLLALRARIRPPSVVSGIPEQPSDSDLLRNRFQSTHIRSKCL